jgi:histidinol-phosphate aminotransferase
VLPPALARAVRPGLTEAAPYDARHHDFAWSHPELDRLMSNECPLPPPPAVIAAARAALDVCNLYPNSGQDLRAAAAAFAGVDPEYVILGNGSTEILDVVTRTFVDRDDEVVIHVPTYAFFETQARINGGRPVLVPLKDDFGFDPDAIRAAVTARTKAIFLCSPNNPTGNSWTVDELREVLAADVPTIVDQAYLECGYSTSFAPLVREHPNLIVTRTMSKAFGLAALRVGYGVAHPALIDTLLRVRIPFSLSLVALRAGLAAFANPAVLEERRRYISDEREAVFRGLSSMPSVTPYPSDGNFILVDISRTGQSAPQIVEEAKQEGVLLRAMTAHRLQGAFVRVTIGTTEQNRHFLRVFRHAIGLPADHSAA